MLRPRLMTRCLLALSLSLGSTCALAQTPTGGNAQSSGYAVPIGGALKYDNDVVWSRLVQLAGGKGARFVVFATAASNPTRSAELTIAALQKHGAVAEHIAVAPRLKDVDLKKAVEDPALIAKVRAARGVYFTGGAQERITDTLQPGGKPTALLQAVWDVYRSGGVVAGSSAGAAIMSTTMFRDAQDVLNVMKHGMREGKEIDRGLGFVGDALFVDQHFLKRGRFGRMLPLMQAKGYTWGIGVDEDSAAIIRGSQIEVIGAKGALLVDLSQATRNAALAEFNIRGARLTYLDRGDRYDIAKREITPSPQKLKDLRIDPNAADFKPYFGTDAYWPDMLGDSIIVNAMGNLLDNKQREAFGLAYSGAPAATDSKPDLGFEFRLYKGADTIGWFTGSFGGEDYTVANMLLDVTPVRMNRPFYTPLAAPAVGTTPVKR